VSLEDDSRFIEFYNLVGCGVVGGGWGGRLGGLGWSQLASKSDSDPNPYPNPNPTPPGVHGDEP